MKTRYVLTVMTGILAASSAVMAAVDVVAFDRAHHVLTRWASDGTVLWQNASIAHDAYQLETGPDGYLYLGGFTDDRVYRIDPHTGTHVTVAHQQAAATDRTWDITFGNDTDGDGIADLWIAAGHNGAGDGYILTYGSASGYAGSSERVWVITDVTRRTVALDFGPDVSGDGMADLWVLDGEGNDSGNFLLVLDGRTGATLNSWPLGALRAPKDVEVEDDRIYITSSGGHEIFSYALDGTDETKVVDGSNSPEYYPRQIQKGLDGMWYTANRFPGTWSASPSITRFDAGWIFDSVYAELADSDWSGVVTVPAEVDPCPNPSAADLNGDCLVDTEDLVLFTGQWLMNSVPAVQP